jgi:3-isopropylmalate dehydrogenase
MRHYKVACLAGDGVGPELMAEASRALAAVAHQHGFELQEVHVPYGGEAFLRSGQLLPLSTRTAFLDADAILVGAARGPALEGVESELDLRALVTEVRLGETGSVSVVGPSDDEAMAWALERAFVRARSRRARVAVVEVDGARNRFLDGVAEHHAGVIVERLPLADAVPALAFDPERFDVVVSGSHFAEGLASVVGSGTGRRRVAAVGRLAEDGPGVFAPTHGAEPEIAGQGVANPSSLLLAATLMLAEGLGERGAAETLAGAVAHALGNGVRTPDLVTSGVAATTREFTDVVLAELPGAWTNAEFHRGAAA